MGNDLSCDFAVPSVRTSRTSVKGALQDFFFLKQNSGKFSLPFFFFSPMQWSCVLHRVTAWFVLEERTAEIDILAKPAQNQSGSPALQQS